MATVIHYEYRAVGSCMSHIVTIRAKTVPVLVITEDRKKKTTNKGII